MSDRTEELGTVTLVVEMLSVLVSAVVDKNRADRVLGEEGFYAQHDASERVYAAETQFEEVLEAYVTKRISKALEEVLHGLESP